MGKATPGSRPWGMPRCERHNWSCAEQGGQGEEPRAGSALSKARAAPCSAFPCSRPCAPSVGSCQLTLTLSSPFLIPCFESSAGGGFCLINEWHKDPQQCKGKQLYYVFLGKQGWSAEPTQAHELQDARAPGREDNPEAAEPFAGHPQGSHQGCSINSRCHPSAGHSCHCQSTDKHRGT